MLLWAQRALTQQMLQRRKQEEHAALSVWQRAVAKLRAAEEARQEADVLLARAREAGAVAKAAFAQIRGAVQIQELIALSERVRATEQGLREAQDRRSQRQENVGRCEAASQAARAAWRLAHARREAVELFASRQRQELGRRRASHEAALDDEVRQRAALRPVR